MRPAFVGPLLLPQWAIGYQEPESRPATRDYHGEFMGRIYTRHQSSERLLRDIRHSVAKRTYNEKKGRQRQRLLGGGLGKLQLVSHDVRKSAALSAANAALRVTDETLSLDDLRLSWDDSELCDWAQAKSRECKRLADTSVMPGWEIRELLRVYGLDLPVRDLFGLEGAIERACSEGWWRRQARVLKARKIDQLARDFRMVHAKGQVYCSNEAVQLRRNQARRNRALLEGMKAENNEGDVYTLAELSDLSTSNPENRRNELMVRMKGFEQVADELGHSGLFITVTCPSRFHPMRQIKNNKGYVVRVEKNPNYEGATPREAQAWLTKTWELTRSKLERRDIRIYGFRVVEPNHDGCPHWHMLLFTEAGKAHELCDIIKSYALRTDADEKGASDYRTKIVPIDKEKGSATGYIAKYISKNIDGSHIDNDLIGNSGSDAAERICAWASTWGIRQFQQIGGASVTVWRELRRLQCEEEGHVEQIRKAADSSDWAAFCLLMGGVFARRDEQPLRPAYWLEFDAETGEEIDPGLNAYGEEAPGRLFGVQECGVRYIATRFYQWSVDRISKAAADVAVKLSDAGQRWVSFLQGAQPPALDLCQ